MGGLGADLTIMLPTWCCRQPRATVDMESIPQGPVIEALGGADVFKYKGEEGDAM